MITPLDRTTLPQQLRTRDRQRLRDYADNLRFYNGAQWLNDWSASTTKQRRDRRLTMNYAKANVQKVTSYLMGDIAFAVDPDTSSPSAAQTAHAQEVEDALYTVHRDNALAELDYATELDTAILGDGAYKVTWDPEQGRVSVTAPDVQGLYAWTRAARPREPYRVALRYQMDPEEAAQSYRYSAPAGGRPKQVEVVEDWTADRFQVWLDGAPTPPHPNPYGELPFILFPNTPVPKSLWGESDLAQLIEPARELNRALTQLSRIMELSGNPIAVLENVDKGEDIAVSPGAVWEVPEKAKAYLLDLLAGHGVQLHTAFVDLVYRSLHDLTETPRTAFGENQRVLSGVALEVELQPLLQKVKRKRVIREAAYNRRNALILRLLARYAGLDIAGVRPRVLWGPIAPRDFARDVANEQILVAAGVHSRRRAGDELGVENTEAEFGRWLEEERQVLAVQQANQPQGVPGTAPNPRAQAQAAGG